MIQLKHSIMYVHDIKDTQKNIEQEPSKYFASRGQDNMTPTLVVANLAKAIHTPDQRYPVLFPTL